MRTRWISYQQAAEKSGRGISTLRLWRAQGMRTMQRGKRVWIDEEDMWAWKSRMDFLNPKRPKRKEAA